MKMANTKCWQCLIVLNKILAQVETLNRTFYNLQTPLEPKKVLDFESMISIPDHLRDTLMVIIKNNHPMTTEQISSITNNSRTTESSHLNQLRTIGYITTERRGKYTYFGLSKKIILPALENRQ
jgi:DNA-binding transcriptional ArsR family regulator